MATWNEIHSFQDLFIFKDEIQIPADNPKLDKFKETAQKLAHGYWIEAQDVVDSVTEKYKRYNQTNECSRLYAHIAQALTGQEPPKRPLRLRHHDILLHCFVKNKETAIIINNIDLLKQETIITFFADQKTRRKPPALDVGSSRWRL